MITTKAREHIERARETLARSEAVKVKHHPPSPPAGVKKEIFREALARGKAASAWETTPQ